MHGATALEIAQARLDVAWRKAARAHADFLGCGTEHPWGHLVLKARPVSKTRTGVPGAGTTGSHQGGVDRRLQTAGSCAPSRLQVLHAWRTVPHAELPRTCLDVAKGSDTWAVSSLAQAAPHTQVNVSWRAVPSARQTCTISQPADLPERCSLSTTLRPAQYPTGAELSGQWLLRCLLPSFRSLIQCPL